MKKVKRMLLVPLLLAAVLLIIHTVVIVSGGAHILTLETTDGEIVSGLPEEKADCILILGAGVRNGAPSAMLKERLELGAALFRAGAADTILVSGDYDSEYYNEPQVMADYLTGAKGVPQACVLSDAAGFSTYESIVRAKDVFGMKSVIIVTQKYHLYRALYIASALGMEAYGADAQRESYFGRSYREARECLARIKDFFVCLSRGR